MVARSVFKRLEEPEAVVRLIKNRLAKLILESVTKDPPELVPLNRAFGRILLEDLRAPISLPYYPRSLVDGCAVRSADVRSASEDSPVQLKYAGRVKIGEKPLKRLGVGECVEVDTGAWVPVGADGVVPIEYVEHGDDVASIYRSVGSGKNMALPASDVARRDLVLSKYVLLDSKLIASIAALGISNIRVARKLSVAIASTGDELVEPGDELGEAKIYDSNRYYLSSRLSSLGISVLDMGIVSDDLGDISAFLEEASKKADFIVFSGGTSAGPDDLVYRAVGNMGKIYVHGIRIKPGKPTVIGEVNGKPFFGLPGNPRSAANVMEKIIIPALSQAGIILQTPCRKTKVSLAYSVYGEQGRTTYLPVAINGGIGYPVARESYMIVSYANSDGIVVVPKDRHTPLRAGDTIEIIMERIQERRTVVSYTDIERLDVEIPVDRPYRILHVPYIVDPRQIVEYSQSIVMILSDNIVSELENVDVQEIGERTLFFVKNKKAGICGKIAVREGYISSLKRIETDDPMLIVTPRFDTSLQLLLQGYVDCAILPEEYVEHDLENEDFENIPVKKEKLYWGFL